MAVSLCTGTVARLVKAAEWEGQNSVSAESQLKSRTADSRALPIRWVWMTQGDYGLRPMTVCFISTVADFFEFQPFPAGTHFLSLEMGMAMSGFSRESTFFIGRPTHQSRRFRCLSSRKRRFERCSRTGILVACGWGFTRGA